MTVFIELIFSEITSFTSMGRVFAQGYGALFGKTLIYYTAPFSCRSKALAFILRLFIFYVL